MHEKHQSMDPEYQAILERCGGLPPHAFTLSSQSSHPADLQAIHEEPAVDGSSHGDQLNLRESSGLWEGFIWSLFLPAFPSNPPPDGIPLDHVPAAQDDQDRTIGIGNPFPETWSSFEDVLTNVLPIDTVVLDNDPASTQQKPCELLALLQPD